MSGYRGLRHRMLARFGGTNGLSSAERTATLCLLVPESDEDAALEAPTVAQS